MIKKYLPLAIAFLCGVAVCSTTWFFMCKNNKKAQKFKAVEIVSYKLKEGVSESDHKQAIYELNGELKKQKGFISRVVSQNGDTFYDVVFWKKLENKQSTIEDFSKNEKAQAFFALIEEKSINTTEGDVVIAFSAFAKSSGKKDYKSKFPKSDMEDYKGYKKYKKCLNKDEDQSKCDEYKDKYENFVKKYGEQYDGDSQNPAKSKKVSFNFGGDLKLLV